MDKLEVIKKMEEKGLTPAKVAEAMQFDRTIMALYLVKDPYPVPPRILEKVAQVVAS